MRVAVDAHWKNEHEVKDAAMALGTPGLIKRIAADRALITKNGGIDFNSVNLGLVIKRDGKGVPLPLAQQDMAQLSRILGFEAEIVSIKPAINVPIINELQQKLQSVS